jgi:thioredoxin-dependent peroxiredoxin
MVNVTFKGKPVRTCGTLPAVGDPAPDFRLTRGDLSDVALKDFQGRILVLNIVPSLDTSVCALSAKRFEREVKKHPGLVVLTVSRDLPFAQGRFCKAEGVENVIMLSELRDLSFGRDYGVEMVDGPLAGLLSRSVVAVNAKGKVVYTEQVPEIGQEPDYERVLSAVKGLL